MKKSVEYGYLHRSPRIAGCLHNALGYHTGGHNQRADEHYAHICRSFGNNIGFHTECNQYFFGKEDTYYRYDGGEGSADNE